MDENEVLLESFVSEYRDCLVMDGIVDPLSRQLLIPTQPSPPKLLPEDVDALLNCHSKRSRKEKICLATLELKMLVKISYSYYVYFMEYSRTRKKLIHPDAVDNKQLQSMYPGSPRRYRSCRCHA